MTRALRSQTKLSFSFRFASQVDKLWPSTAFQPRSTGLIVRKYRERDFTCKGKLPNCRGQSLCESVMQTSSNCQSASVRTLANLRMEAGKTDGFRTDLTNRVLGPFR